MRQVVDTYNVYKFEELSEQAKKVALEKLYDVNVAFDWWDCTYEDLDSQLDIEVESFDLGRGQECTVKEAFFEKCINQKLVDYFKNSNITIAVSNYEEALKKLDENTDLQNKYYEDSDKLDTLIDESRELEDNYLDSIARVKLEVEDVILQNLKSEYEYLTSEEAIIETIEANEYEFYKSGKVYI